MIFKYHKEIQRCANLRDHLNFHSILFGGFLVVGVGWLVGVNVFWDFLTVKSCYANGLP